jgi:hypothetical protein
VWLALGLLLGVISGVVIGVAAGARRTDSAFSRLLQVDHAAHVLVAAQNTGLGRHGYYAAISRLPEVQEVAEATVVGLAIRSSDGHVDPNISAIDSIDGRFGYSLDRPKLLEGQMPDPSRADEIVIDQQLANLAHVGAGDRLKMLAVPNDAQGNADLKLAYPLTFDVTGVVVFDSQIVPVSQSDAEPQLLLTPAFYRTKSGRTLPGADGAYILLRPSASIASFDRQITQLAGRIPSAGGIPFISNLADQRVEVQRAIEPEALALALFALFAGLLSLVVVGQLLTRQLILDASDSPILRSLGMDRRQILAISLVRAAAISVTGGLTAVGVAVLVSPLFPIGPARLAEPAPGFQFDWAALGIGFLCVTLLPLVVVLPGLWRIARVANVSPRPSFFVGRVVSLVKRSVPASLGAHMALSPGEQTSVPVRSALVGTTIAISALIAALIFGASLSTLVSSPRLYGQTWNLEFSLGFGSVPTSLGDSILSSIHGVVATTAGNYGTVSIKGKEIPAVGIRYLRGDTFLTLLNGRPPRTDDEIVLGARSLRNADKAVGDDVGVRVNGITRRMHIVGEAVFPNFGEGSFTPTSLGDGAAVVSSLLPPTSTGGCPHGAQCFGFFLLKLDSPVPTATDQRRVLAAAHADGCPIDQCVAVAKQVPIDIENFSRVLDTPIVLAGLLAVLATGAIAHVLLTSIRRRRRDLALLKVLGFVRRQVHQTVAWQASILVIVALAIGVPLGLVAGRAAWALFADSVGVSSIATIPVLAILLTVPATLALANVIAAIPAWLAGRVRPGLALRTE